MKKLLFILFVFIGFSSCKRETYNDVVKTDVNKKLLVGKWTVSYVNNGFAPKVGDFVFLSSDGTGSLLSGTAYSQGTWSLTELTFSSTFITNYFTQGKNSITTYNLVTLTEKEMILNTSANRDSIKIILTQ